MQLKVSCPGLLIIFVFLFAKVLIAQNGECGMEYLFTATINSLGNDSISVPKEVGLGLYTRKEDRYFIPIEFVIVGPNNCDSNPRTILVDSLILHQELVNLQEQFGKHNICFLLVDIRKVCNDNLWNMKYHINRRFQHALRLGYDTNVLTVFIIKYLVGGSGDPSGVASSIGDIPAFAFVEDTTIIQDLKVTAHEIGHCLGLRHVFAGYCEGSSEEYVWTYDLNLRPTASNGRCATTGDYVCDTYPVPLKNLMLIGELANGRTKIRSVANSI